MKILISIFKIITLNLLCVFWINPAFCQDIFNDNMPSIVPPDEGYEQTFNTAGWRFGINMGMYFANKETADFYSGIPVNENNIKYVLDNKYWYEEIKQELNSHRILDTQGNPVAMPATDKSTDWWIYYPEGLKYNAAISPGFYVKYNFNNSTGIFLQSNYVKLKTSGVFQMVIDSVNYLSDPALREGYIRGIEERISVDLGISKFYRVGEITHVFIEMGLHMNSTEALENRIQIGAKEYSIVDIYLNGSYIPGPGGNTQEYSIYQGGIGFGILLAGGVKFIVSDKISIDPGVQFTYKKQNLTNYTNFTMDTYVFVRLIFDLFGEN